MKPETKPEMEDEAILLMAVNEKAIIITMDKSFGELVYKATKPHYRVLLIRIVDTVSEKNWLLFKIYLQTRLKKIKKNCSFPKG